MVLQPPAARPAPQGVRMVSIGMAEALSARGGRPKPAEGSGRPAIALVPIPTAKVCVPPVVREPRTAASEACLLRQQAAALFEAAQRALAGLPPRTGGARGWEHAVLPGGGGNCAREALDLEGVESETGGLEVPEHLQVRAVLQRLALEG